MKQNNIISSLPGGFYDLIVYYGSSLLFLTIFVFSSFKLEEIESFSKSLSTTEKIFLSVVVVFVSYILGLFSSTFSSHVIKKTVTRVARKLKFKSLKDYEFDYFDDFDKHNFIILDLIEKKMKGNYWSIIYLIKMYKPDIADDILKRYARCKLARNNAFNFLLLSLGALISGVWTNLTSKSSPFFDVFLSPAIWSIIFFIIAIIFTLEFYQRQVWFGDILIKIYASFYVWLSKE